MPDTGSGIYEVVLVQQYQSQEILNVFHYRSTTNADDLQNSCGLAFNVDILPTIAGLVSTGLTFVEIEVRNLTGNLADVSVVPGVANGTVIGEQATSFVSIPFRYNRTTKETRNGGKRFAGAVEEALSFTGFTASFFTTMQTAALVLDNPIVNAANTFNPIILRKPDLGLGIYRYNEVSSVQALNRSTSQNSRKAF